MRIWKRKNYFCSDGWKKIGTKVKEGEIISSQYSADVAVSKFSTDLMSIYTILFNLLQIRKFHRTRAMTNKKYI